VNGELKLNICIPVLLIVHGKLVGPVLQFISNKNMD